MQVVAGSHVQLLFLFIVDEAGPGPVKSKYDALDFDTLLKEAQKSLHRWRHSAPDWPALLHCSNTSDYMALPSERLLSTSMQGHLADVYIFTIGIKKR